MSLTDGCPYVAGPACEGCTGSCWAAPPEEIPRTEPTLVEWCAIYGHPPHAVDGGFERCLCGEQSYRMITDVVIEGGLL